MCNFFSRLLVTLSFISLIINSQLIKSWCKTITCEVWIRYPLGFLFMAWYSDYLMNWCIFYPRTINLRRFQYGVVRRFDKDQTSHPEIVILRSSSWGRGRWVRKWLIRQSALETSSGSVTGNGGGFRWPVSSVLPHLPVLLGWRTSARFVVLLSFEDIYSPYVCH